MVAPENRRVDGDGSSSSTRSGPETRRGKAATANKDGVSRLDSATRAQRFVYGVDLSPDE